ncbi:MAG: HEAT repeat domain-containing protein [Mariprofundaceae bacterium]|nr:HEAT repeat domain-containing protein [Mariprofundaceae bacterium]
MPLIKSLGTKAIPLLYPYLLTTLSSDEQGLYDDDEGDLSVGDIFEFLAELGDEAAPILLKFTDYKYWRGFVIRCLGKTRSQAAIPYLKAYLDDAADSTRIRAMQALSHITEPPIGGCPRTGKRFSATIRAYDYKV